MVASAKKLGIVLEPRDGGGEPQAFSIAAGGEFFVMLMPAPHPDAPRMPYGPTSPSIEEATQAPAHFVLTAMGIEGDERRRDLVMALLTACVIDHTDAVGAMLGHGVVFHRAPLFSKLAALGAQKGLLPPEIAIDVTAANEGGGRMSFLSHNMTRYGREDFFVTCPVEGKGAFDFLLMMVRWLYTDLEKVLRTGDTVGRTADEKIAIQRVPNPTGSGQTVIRLDL
ncbi:MAG: hypothetical protein AB1938_31930 [Myxococcota bacterium]